MKSCVKLTLVTVDKWTEQGNYLIITQGWLGKSYMVMVHICASRFNIKCQDTYIFLHNHENI